MDFNQAQNNTWISTPHNLDLQIPEVKTNIEEVTKPYKPLIIENKWRFTIEKIETDLKMMNHNEIVDHFLNNGVYKHILYLDSESLFQALKNKLVLLDNASIRKKIFSNTRLTESLFSSENWKEFLFQLFENNTEKEMIIPSFHLSLMIKDQERYLSSIENNTKLVEKISRSGFRSAFSQINYVLNKKKTN